MPTSRGEPLPALPFIPLPTRVDQKPFAPSRLLEYLSSIPKDAEMPIPLLRPLSLLVPWTGLDATTPVSLCRQDACRYPRLRRSNRHSRCRLAVLSNIPEA